jgi:hypothetical protein
VTEIFKREVLWDGVVEVFDLIGYPKAKRAYAWSYREGNEDKTTVVLGTPPIDSPHSAVMIAIAAKGRTD